MHKGNSTVIQTLTVQFNDETSDASDKSSPQYYPSKFSVNLTEISPEFAFIEFEIIAQNSNEHPIASSDIYIFDLSGKVVKHNTNIKNGKVNKNLI